MSEKAELDVYKGDSIDTYKPGQIQPREQQTLQPQIVEDSPDSSNGSYALLAVAVSSVQLLV